MSEESGNKSGGSGYSSGRGLGRFFNNLGTLMLNARSLPQHVRSISDVGIDFSLIGKKNRLGVSRKEQEMLDDEDALLIAALGQDLEIDGKDKPYFDAKYKDRIEFLNLFATHPEIEFILQTIADEAIVYDKYGKFCDVSLGDLNIKEEIQKTILKNFRRIYTLFGFNDGITAWAYFLQWLTEGFLMFEIIFDDINNPTRITGFEELPPESMVALIVDEEYDEVKDQKKTGKRKKRKRRIWKQVVTRKDGTGVQEERTMSDNSVIFISWNRVPGNKGRVSYTERLVRSFNLMRTMENTKVAWHVMNSQFRLKMVIPVGTKTTAKAKQALAQVTNKYKEDLFIDHDSGQVFINGQAKINFGRNIVLPSRQGSSPEIDGVQYTGPDLSRMEAVEYFERKLWRDSRLPFSRFDRENGGGNKILFSAEGIPHDELAFYRFINRARREFEKIIKVPLYIQTILDHPELKIDLEFKSKLGIAYESNSLFEAAKEHELLERKLRQVGDLERVTEIDGRTPIYSKKYLYVKKTEIMNEEEWEENRKLRDKELEEAKEREKREGADGYF